MNNLYLLGLLILIILYTYDLAHPMTYNKILLEVRQ